MTSVQYIPLPAFLCHKVQQREGGREFQRRTRGRRQMRLCRMVGIAREETEEVASEQPRQRDFRWSWNRVK